MNVSRIQFKDEHKNLNLVLTVGENLKMKIVKQIILKNFDMNGYWIKFLLNELR
jgi:hypothetical protein